MRLKLLDKGSPVSTAYGISDNKEKSFKKSIVCIREGDKIYKILSLVASKKDGSISLFFNYCIEKRALIVRHKHKYKPGPQLIDKSKITDEFEIEFTVDETAKLSLHESGFVQLSGKGIISGIDLETGRPKGVGVFSNSLKTPVSSGPTCGFVCWGLDKGFELLKEQKSGIQYLILESNDFTEREIEPNKDLNSYILEFFIFPKEANEYVYEYLDKPYINHIINNYIHKPGILLAHPVLDLKFFEGVIALLPCVSWTGFADEIKCGYSLGSPGGSDSQFDEVKTGYNFQLFCPSDKSHSLLGEENVKTLKYKNPGFDGILRG